MLFLMMEKKSYFRNPEGPSNQISYNLYSAFIQNTREINAEKADVFVTTGIKGYPMEFQPYKHAESQGNHQHTTLLEEGYDVSCFRWNLLSATILQGDEKA